MLAYLDQSLSRLKHFEGCVPWMYRDTVGRVTVGVGLMLPDAASAQALAFTFDGRPATPQEIVADFRRVQQLASAREPAFYKSPTSPQLPQDVIDAKLLAVLTEFESQVRAKLPCYDSLPDGVKLALLDMAYNLGPAGLFRDYPHMLKAVAAGDWATAAAQCARHGPAPERNTWTRAMFLSGAVVDTLRAEAEGWLTRAGRRLRRLFGMGR